MKRMPSVVVSALCLSTLFAASAHHGRAAAQSKEAELSPVLQSLEKLVRQKGFGRQPGSRGWQRVTSWKSEGCRVSYVITDEGVSADKLGDAASSADLSQHRRFTFGFDLSDLDPRRVEAQPYRGLEGGSVSYRTEGERNLVRFEAEYLHGRADMKAGGWLVLKDREGLDEAASLLRRAVEICRR